MSQVERRYENRILLKGEGILKSIYISDPYQIGDIEGVLLNISNDGFCFSVKRRVEKSIMKVRFHLLCDYPSVTSTLPTLGEVRWIERDRSGNQGYIVGVRYIL